MKLNKIKLGIATLAAAAIFFGLIPKAKADQEYQYNDSIRTHVEVGSERGHETDMTSIKETLEFKLQKKDIIINITGNHINYSGELEGKKTEGNSNSLKIEAGKKFNKGLYLAPYAEFKDDIDPLRELKDDKVYSVSLGALGECLLKEPFTLTGDFKVLILSKGGLGYATRLGIIYYFNDDWISLSGTNWSEPLRDTNTAIGHLTFNHKFNEKLEAQIQAGLGKEYGKGDETVSDLGTNLSYKLSKKLTIGLGYNHYKSKTKKDTVGIGLTWRF